MLQSAIKQLLVANKKRGLLVAQALTLEGIIIEDNEKRVAKVVEDLLNSGLEEVNEEEEE